LAGGIGARAPGFALDLRRQIVEFLLRVTERFGFVAQNALGGVFDSLAKFGDIPACGPLGSRRLGQKAALDQLLPCFWLARRTAS
jgi:hypothetical protein